MDATGKKAVKPEDILRDARKTLDEAKETSARVNLDITRRNLQDSLEEEKNRRENSGK